MKQTNNRKSVSFARTIKHDGSEYRINGSEIYGVYLQPLHAAIDQLDVCIKKWGRVFAMRFDLHQKVETETSEMMTRFRKHLVQKLVRKYQMRFMGYAWVREKETAKSQHYHVMIFLDGNRIRHSTKISKIISETWKQICKGNHAHIVKHCFYNIVDATTKANAIYRLSYLAKSRGKGYRPPQAKDYGTSRVRA